MKWTKLQGAVQLDAKLAPRYGHHIFVDEKQDFLILHGGHTSASSSGSHSQPETETWLYSFDRNAWTTLPSGLSPPLAAAYVDNTLYTISVSPDKDSPNLSGQINYLDVRKSTAEREKPGGLVWQSVTYPINPLTPGPRPRVGGALVPLTTGYGRSYLIYMFGVSSDSLGESTHANAPEEEKYYSDIWALQLPSHGFSAAAAKDVIRDKLMPKGIESSKFTWAEAELVATEQKPELEEGKVHPGPRGLLAASGCLEGKGVVLWGGVNPKGEREADGWVLGLAFGYADNDRFE